MNYLRKLFFLSHNEHKNLQRLTVYHINMRAKYQQFVEFNINIIDITICSWFDFLILPTANKMKK